jgi:restriction system protein
MPARSRRGRRHEGPTSAPVFLGLAAGPLVVVTLIVVALLSKVDSALTTAIVSPRHHSTYGAVWWFMFAAGLAACFRTAWYLHAERETRTQARIATYAELLALTPTQFEHAVANLFNRHGYKDVRVVGKRGDRGADIAARDPGGVRIIVQCKRYAPGRTVGSPDVQMLLGAVAQHLHDATRGVFVTTAEFSPPAREMALQHGIELIDGPKLTAMFELVDQQTGVSSGPGSRKLATG